MEREEVEQLRSLREAGRVQRTHTVPSAGGYSDAEHSWQAARLLVRLHPNPSMKLLWAMLTHDCAERWVGDMPAPAKWLFPEIGKPYEEAEEQLLARHNLPVPSRDLTDEERQWLKGCDMLEFWEWCEDQLASGNHHVCTSLAEIKKAVEAAMDNDRLPEPLGEYYIAWHRAGGWRRGRELSDFLEDKE